MTAGTHAMMMSCGSPSHAGAVPALKDVSQRRDSANARPSEPSARPPSAAGASQRPTLVPADCNHPMAPDQVRNWLR